MQLLNMSSCVYYVGRSTFKAGEVASTKARKQESMPDILKEQQEDAVVTGV